MISNLAYLGAAAEVRWVHNGMFLFSNYCNWRERVAQVLLAVAVGVTSTLFPCDLMAVLGDFNVCINKFADVYRPLQSLEMVPASPRSAASMSAQTRPRQYSV